MSYQTLQTCQTCQKLEQLQQQNQELKTEIDRLTRTLQKYENPHTPPSRRMYPTRAGNHQKSQKRYPGRPKGHHGQTRQKQKTPDIIITPPQKKTNCSHCNTPLKETHVTHHLIEEIPTRKHRQVIDYLEFTSECPNCHHNENTIHPECPPQGIFGVNAQTQTTLLKFDLRLPFDKVVEQMELQHGLPMSAATAFEITHRVSKDLSFEYQKVMTQIRESSIVNVDETSIKVDGVKFWLWTFVTKTGILYIIRRSRGKKVLVEVLGEGFSGYIGCDGWKPYSCFSGRLQRCWAHLLREAKALVEKCVEAEGLYLGLKGLYWDVGYCLVGVPVWMRLGIREEVEKRLEGLLLVYDGCKSGEVRRFVSKVRNGFDYWFSFVVVEGLEATNNLAENALREAVVQRKIFGTLRNEKGVGIYESLMSLIATWKLQGLDLYEAMSQKLIESWTKQRS